MSSMIFQYYHNVSFMHWLMSVCVCVCVCVCLRACMYLKLGIVEIWGRTRDLWIRYPSLYHWAISTKELQNIIVFVCVCMYGSCQCVFESMYLFEAKYKVDIWGRSRDLWTRYPSLFHWAISTKELQNIIVCVCICLCIDDTS